jgi:CRP-like cAMP-binding protein
VTEAPSSSETNLLLASLPAQKQRRLLRLCEVVVLRATEDLHDVGQSIEFVHFPKKGCVISLVKFLDDGGAFDAGWVGYEGFTGLEALSEGETAFRATVRVGGAAFRLRANDLQTELRDSRKWSEVLLRYLHYFLVHVSQRSGCNRFHALQPHFCALLLNMHDRITGDDLEITHGIFAKMMGVRRVGITQAARKLQDDGVIRYSWGKLTILDRQRLETHACVCYKQMTQAYQRMLDSNWPYR